MNNILTAAQKIYLDANVIIYLIEGNEGFQSKAESVFQYADDNGIQLLTSEIAASECLYGAFRADSPTLVEKYRGFFSDRELVQLVPIEYHICTEAAKLGALHRLKLIDAIHFATATDIGCDVFVTNDKGIRSSEDLRILQLADI